MSFRQDIHFVKADDVHKIFAVRRADQAILNIRLDHMLHAIPLELLRKHFVEGCGAKVGGNFAEAALNGPAIGAEACSIARGLKAQRGRKVKAPKGASPQSHCRVKVQALGQPRLQTRLRPPDRRRGSVEGKEEGRVPNLSVHAAERKAGQLADGDRTSGRSRGRNARQRGR